MLHGVILAQMIISIIYVFLLCSIKLLRMDTKSCMIHVLQHQRRYIQIQSTEDEGNTMLNGLLRKEPILAASTNIPIIMCMRSSLFIKHI